MSDWIKFMGTAGARFVVSKQLRSSAGIWCRLQGLNILIDPGPGTLSRCFDSGVKQNPEQLDAIILTHRHLDHSTDVNVMVEAMTEGTFNHRGALFAPSDAVAADEPVVFRHARRSVERLEQLAEGKSYRLGPLRFSTPVRHRHPVETYGLVFDLPRVRVSLISDTRYFPQLVEHYRESNLLIINTLLFEPLPYKEIQHLNLADARELIKGIKPDLAVLTHFGLTMLRHDPEALARRLSEETGTRVLAAADGMTLDLNNLGTQY